MSVSNQEVFTKRMATARLMSFFVMSVIAVELLAISGKDLVAHAGYYFLVTIAAAFWVRVSVMKNIRMQELQCQAQDDEETAEACRKLCKGSRTRLSNVFAGIFVISSVALVAGMMLEGVMRVQ